MKFKKKKSCKNHDSTATVDLGSEEEIESFAMGLFQNKSVSTLTIQRGRDGNINYISFVNQAEMSIVSMSQEEPVIIDITL